MGTEARLRERANVRAPILGERSVTAQRSENRALRSSSMIIAVSPLRTVHGKTGSLIDVKCFVHYELFPRSAFQVPNLSKAP